jgi:hypothetical protein
VPRTGWRSARGRGHGIRDAGSRDGSDSGDDCRRQNGPQPCRVLLNIAPVSCPTATPWTPAGRTSARRACHRQEPRHDWGHQGAALSGRGRGQ